MEVQLQERREVERQEAEAALERERRLEEEVQRVRNRILERVDAGEKVLLYHRVYLPVDSVILDESLNSGFDTSSLFELGVEGWEIVGVVPRTLATGLKNASLGSTVGTSWGGGTGGNVIGVYVLLRKTLSPTDVTGDGENLLFRIIRAQLSAD